MLELYYTTYGLSLAYDVFLIQPLKGLGMYFAFVKINQWIFPPKTHFGNDFATKLQEYMLNKATAIEHQESLAKSQTVQLEMTDFKRDTSDAMDATDATDDIPYKTLRRKTLRKKSSIVLKHRTSYKITHEGEKVEVTKRVKSVRRKASVKRKTSVKKKSSLKRKPLVRKQSTKRKIKNEDTADVDVKEIELVKMKKDAAKDEEAKIESKYVNGIPSLDNLQMNLPVRIRSTEELQTIFNSPTSQWSTGLGPRVDNNTATRLAAADKNGRVVRIDPSDQTVQIHIESETTQQLWFTLEMFVITGRVI